MDGEPEATFRRSVPSDRGESLIHRVVPPERAPPERPNNAAWPSPSPLLRSAVPPTSWPPPLPPPCARNPRPRRTCLVPRSRPFGGCPRAAPCLGCTKPATTYSQTTPSPSASRMNRYAGSTMHRGDAVLARLGAGDPAVAVVVPQREGIDDVLLAIHCRIRGAACCCRSAFACAHLRRVASRQHGLHGFRFRRVNGQPVLAPDLQRPGGRRLG